ncbi:MAG: hypothetical protein D6775_02815 [Caldilineae bacterium]|nr:MAG: hypothetical protein D6775_02815 [Caldilineae bacterium]
MEIELAPRNKRGLRLDTPLLAGSGAVGFGDSWPPGLQPRLFGAIITQGVTMQPQRGTAQPRLAEIPAGFLLASGDHNPGFRRVMAQQAGTWQRLPTPVILSLLGGEPGARAWMAARLEESEVNIAGIELPVPEDVNLSEASAFISAVRQVTTLPILVRLPATRAAHLARACVVAGADALIVGTPPPAEYPTEEGLILQAPIGGPVAFPFTLRALRGVMALGLDVPIVAAGGIHTLDDMALCLELGAAAVAVRSLLWTNPNAAADLARRAHALLPDIPPSLLSPET